MDTIKAFLDYLKLEKNYSPHTITAYKNDLLAFSGFIFEEFSEDDLSKVNYPLIRNWIVSLFEDGISNRSINRKLSTLNSFFGFLQKLGEIKHSPLANHKPLKVEKKIQVPFSKKEVEQVISAFAPETFEDFRDKAIIELFYSTGMRRAELINLKDSDLDLRSKKIKVLGKRSKERFVPLVSTVLETLRLYLQKRDDEFETTSENLFVTSKNAKIYETLVYRIINSYFSNVSSKVKQSPHILRHSFATHLLNEGANLNAIKELLGHSSLAATQVYTHNDIASLKSSYSKAHPRNK